VQNTVIDQHANLLNSELKNHFFHFWSIVSLWMCCLF